MLRQKFKELEAISAPVLYTKTSR